MKMLFRGCLLAVMRLGKEITEQCDADLVCADVVYCMLFMLLFIFRLEMCA